MGCQDHSGKPCGLSDRVIVGNSLCPAVVLRIKIYILFSSLMYFSKVYSFRSMLQDTLVSTFGRTLPQSFFDREDGAVLEE